MEAIFFSKNMVSWIFLYVYVFCFRKSTKRKCNISEIDLLSKYRVVEQISSSASGGALTTRVITKNESGTCLRLASSSNRHYMASVLGPTRNSHQPSSAGLTHGGGNGGSASGFSYSQQDDSSGSPIADTNSSELVSLLQELGPDEIVNMLRKKGIKLTSSTSSPTSSTASTSFVAANNKSSQQLHQHSNDSRNVIVMNSSSSSSHQSSQHQVSAKSMTGGSSSDSDYNVDSIDPSVMEVISEVDDYAVETVRQAISSHRQQQQHQYSGSSGKETN